MMSVCAVGSGKRSRSDVPAAIFASIELNVAVVAASRCAADGTPWQDGAAVAAPASAGLANATPAASRLPAPAMRRDLATTTASGIDLPASRRRIGPALTDIGDFSSG